MPAQAVGGEALAASASGVRVLMVDDNENAATLLAEARVQAGHRTVVAHDGPAALHSAARFHPDVALLDIGLPVMDGFELARNIRTAPDLKAIRLVAVTGYGQEHDRRRSEAALFDAHLVKPVDVQQVSDLIVKLARDKPGL
jgi:CheY-like chemotaxis protein